MSEPIKSARRELFEAKEIIADLKKEVGEISKNRDAHMAASRVSFNHELIGPVPECACASCNLHHKYSQKLTDLRNEIKRNDHK